MNQPKLETIIVTFIYPIDPANPHPGDGKPRVITLEESTLASAIEYYQPSIRW